MGIKTDLFKKGINYVLKSAQNSAPKAKLSVFDGVEGTSAKNIASVFETKVPLKQGATNPFDNIEKLHLDSVSPEVQRKNVATFLRYLDSFKGGRSEEAANNVRELLLKNPEVMQTMPASNVNLALLNNFWAKNPTSWKAEYAKIPFDKIKSSGQVDMYIRSLLSYPKQVAHSYDTKSCIRTFGQKGHNGTVEVFDLSSLKMADGSYDKSKLAIYINYIKSLESRTTDENLKGIKVLFDNVPSGQEVVEKYPKAMECLLDNFVDRTYVRPHTFMNFFNNFFPKVENLLNSGTAYAGKNYDNIIQLINRANIYEMVVSNPELASLSKADISGACETFDRLLSGFHSEFLKYNKEDQVKIIKLARTLPKEDIKYFDFLARNPKYKDLIDKTVQKPELLSEIRKNQDRIDKLIPDTQSSFHKITVRDQLALMKTYYPSEYYSLAKTKGFKQIQAGYLDISILKDIKYNSGNEYFNNIYSKLEEAAQAMPLYKELSPQMQEIYMNVALYDPAGVNAFCQTVLRAKDSALFCKALKFANNSANKMKKTISQMEEGGYYLKPDDLKTSRKNIAEFLEIAANNPEEMKLAFKFKGNVADFSKLAQNIEKKIIPDDIQKILFEYSDKFNASNVNSIAKFIKSGEDTALLREMLNEITTSGRIDASRMSYILNNASHNNIEWIKNTLSNDGYKNLYNVQCVAYFTKDIKEFSQLGNQQQIIKSLDEIMTLAHGEISGYNMDAIKNILELKVSHPEKYQQLEQTGIFDYIETTGEPISILGKINENAKLSPYLLNDLKLWKEGKSIVPSFSAETPLADAMSKTQTGDVVEVGDKLFINDGKQMYQWDMTKDKYLELFPPVKRFTTQQGALGDCYLVSSLNSIMQNPQTRVNLYKSFKLEGNDVKCTIDAYKDFKGTTTFKDGVIKLDDKSAHLYGCKGLQIIEQSYARTALRDAVKDPLSTASEVNPHKLMNRIYGGWAPEAESELLGLNFNNEWLKELPQDFHKSGVRINDKKSLNNILDNCANGKNYLLNFGTVSKANSTAESNLLSDYSIVSNHAYSILNYDKESKLVTIANPHNASLTFDVPLETLEKYIQNIYVASLV